ncbi:MAG TPA: efflux RND transporter periplasmic adaptor subunit, partial [Candidatus Binataceae bacterium]|nr:efflux RND transporter periplasmic adaptor subunit [Candidatus Binataceae bacterium]
MKPVYLLFAIALPMLGCKTSAATPPSDDAGVSAVLEIHNPAAASEIKVAPVRKQALGGSLATTAVLEPEPTMVARVSPRIEARVVRLIVELGRQVKAGDPLVVLSSIELGKAKTDYLRARSLEAIAAQHLAREERLYADKIASQKDVLNARAARETALAELQAGRETLRSLIPDTDLESLSWSNEQARPLSEFTLRAPIAGVVAKIDLIPGSIIRNDADAL